MASSFEFYLDILLHIRRLETPFLHTSCDSGTLDAAFVIDDATPDRHEPADIEAAETAKPYE
jgi:hypothetical protein